jgi:hypothetical protein
LLSDFDTNLVLSQQDWLNTSPVMDFSGFLLNKKNDEKIDFFPF